MFLIELYKIWFTCLTNNFLFLKYKGKSRKKNRISNLFPRTFFSLFVKLNSRAKVKNEARQSRRFIPVKFGSFDSCEQTLVIIPNLSSFLFFLFNFVKENHIHIRCTWQSQSLSKVSCISDFFDNFFFFFAVSSKILEW